MKWFGNLRIGRKLALSYALTVALAIGLGVFCIGRLAEVNRSTVEIGGDWFSSLKICEQLKADVEHSRAIMLSDVTASTKTEFDDCRRQLSDTDTEVDKLLQRCEPLVTSEQGRELLSAFEEQHAKFVEVVQEIEKLCRANKDKEATAAVNGEGLAAAQKLGSTIDQWIEVNEKGKERAAKAAAATYEHAKYMVFAFLAGLVALSVLLGAVVTRSIAMPVSAVAERMGFLSSNCLADLTDAVVALADGDLTVRCVPKTKKLDIETKDELGMMAGTFNDMLAKTQSMVEAYNRAADSLLGVVDQLQSSALSVSSTSQQMASSANDTSSAATAIAQTIEQVGREIGESARSAQEIAKGTEQLAAAAEGATVAVDVLLRAIGDVSEAGETIAQLMTEAQGIVGSGISAVERTSASMTRIQDQVEESSKSVHELGQQGRQIGAIVQTIEDIAEQTNLLALNAAIEAARAGEQGKGFAVVADEVRKLAERSSSATQEIAALIGNVQQRVEEAVEAMEAGAREVSQGAACSADAADALGQIVASASSVGQMAGKNKLSVEQMSESAAKVQSAILSVGSVSEESASSAQQLSAATEEVAASTEEVSAAVEEQTANIQQVSAAAQQLSSMAAELDAVAHRFKTDGSEARRTSAHLKAA
jgi:methyl-accepting chemotaxis protein